MYLRATECCGIKEIADLAFTAKRPLKEIVVAIENDAIHHYRRCFGLIIFTEIKGQRYGTRLADFIEKNKLGTVTRIEKYRNPNTNHILNTFVWKINWRNLRAFVKKQ